MSSSCLVCVRSVLRCSVLQTNKNFQPSRDTDFPIIPSAIGRTMNWVLATNQLPKSHAVFQNLNLLHSWRSCITAFHLTGVSYSYLGGLLSVCFLCISSTLDLSFFLLYSHSMIVKWKVLGLTQRWHSTSRKFTFPACVHISLVHMTNFNLFTQVVCVNESLRYMSCACFVKMDKF